jgi:phosphatidylserine/phosphatidylglycerophosphate/cardiolipin synthase-like enzyme
MAMRAESMANRGASPGADAAGKEHRARILDPPRNCWRIEPASRAALLIDAAAYFARLDQVLPHARHSVLIVGWDFDHRIHLRADGAPEGPCLGDRLRALVEARPACRVRVLVWSVAVVHAPGAPLPLLFGAGWQDHPRIEVRLDRQHPIYASHHQKLVCIDDALAFTGGIDLTVERWDTRRHAAEDPARVDAGGAGYGPVHDLQMLVEGDAARALGDIARERWRRATGAALAPCAAGPVPWPAGLEPSFVDTPVAIARTSPAWGDAPPVQEGAALLADALRAAERSIYIETQYLSAAPVGDLLAERLAEADGPEIVILVTPASPGLVERFVMGGNRDRLIRRLKRADRFGRLRIFYPVVPSAEGACPVQLHAKLLVVDDCFLRVGSSNLNNRSIGLDTECDLAIEAADPATCAAIAALRARLLAEHLGADPRAVRAAIAEEGSLIRAIDRLNTGPRGLRAFPAMTTPGPTRPIPGTRFLDPRRPFEPLWFLRRARR